jgi:hypothetical protein
VRRLPHARLMRVVLALALFTLSAFALLGCGPKGPVWVEGGGTYTTESLVTLYSAADITKLASTSSSDASKLRHEALVGLRQRGGAAASAADLITKTLPATTAGVPVYVEKATVSGQPALVVIEATGPATGKLTTKRLWALSETGAVLFVGTR